MTKSLFERIFNYYISIDWSTKMSLIFFYFKLTEKGFVNRLPFRDVVTMSLPNFLTKEQIKKFNKLMKCSKSEILDKIIEALESYEFIQIKVISTRFDRKVDEETTITEIIHKTSKEGVFPVKPFNIAGINAKEFDQNNLIEHVISQMGKEIEDPKDWSFTLLISLNDFIKNDSYQLQYKTESI